MNDPALIALACLPAMSPPRLQHVLRHHSPDDALERLRSGASLSPMAVRHISVEGVHALRAQAVTCSVEQSIHRCGAAGVDVVDPRDAGWPPGLDQHPDAPAALFVRGDLAALAARRVGVVGTRNATTAGHTSAFELGHDLAAAGVTVVSGLARGIDGAAHEGVRAGVRVGERAAGERAAGARAAGARAAGGDRGAGETVGRAAAVVGSGLDVPYPSRHRELWEWVGAEGVLVSEYAPGVTPEPWHFPQRNRIIAALSEVLVVVESRERGGSLITAGRAIELGVEVMVVPGSNRSRASAGTNQLLFDGAGIARSADDVLTSLGLDHSRHLTPGAQLRPPPNGIESAILEICRAQPSTLDMIVSTVGCSVSDAALAVARLEMSGWLLEAAGWFEPATSRLGMS